MYDKEMVHPIAWVAIAGLITGIGNLLASAEVLTWRIVLGRAISSAALGASAGLALQFAPAMPLPALVGLSCIMASLGTSGLERLLQKFLNK